MESCNCILKFCLLYDGERLLPLFLSCYVVGSCTCRSWFLINSKLNTGLINFKLMEKVCDVRKNDWNKVSQNIIEEFSWKLQWPVYKNNTVHSLFIFRSKTFYRVPNLLWNEVFSEMKSSLKLVAIFELFVRLAFDFLDWNFLVFELVIIFELFYWPSTFQIRIFLVFSETRGRLWTVRPAFDFPDWNFFSLRTVRPAFNFPDWLEFFSSSDSLKACVVMTFRITWIFFVFKLFKGVILTFRIDLNFFSLRTCSRFRTRDGLWTVRPAFDFTD